MRQQVISYIQSAPILWPGVLTAITIALAATFMSEHQGGPQLLYALFFGMAFNFAANGEKIKAGIDFTARHVLRVGVALLGGRVTLEQISTLGLSSVLLVIGGVISTILFGVLLSCLMRRPLAQGILAGSAVAICGASAALAISVVLPRNEDNLRFTMFVVVGVTALSTVAMVAYPALVEALGLDANAAAVFIGGTIHDVAQVAAAGYMISSEVGDVSTFVKLLRVGMLLPVVMLLSLMFHKHGFDQETKPPLLPKFLLGFAFLMIANSAGLIPQEVGKAFTNLSRWCMVVAIAALGVKTSFKQLTKVGWHPAALLVMNTIFLTLLVLAGLTLMR